MLHIIPKFYTKVLRGEAEGCRRGGQYLVMQFQRKENHVNQNERNDIAVIHYLNAVYSRIDASTIDTGPKTAPTVNSIHWRSLKGEAAHEPHLRLAKAV